jgi:hypothetical protein
MLFFNLIKHPLKTVIYLILIPLFISCHTKSNLPNGSEKLEKTEAVLLDQFHGFWLGQCIANWTGLITEMDKIGGQGKDGKGAGFYTRNDWGKPDQPNIWGSNNYKDTIDFYLVGSEGIWGADDDTDIEYIYQYTIDSLQKPLLSGDEIRLAWLNHIKKEEENFLWVSNQSALDLMIAGKIPPETSDPLLNPHYEMIDAQLTTEIFGLYAPGDSDLALEMAHLPIRVSAREEAAEIAEFYVILYSLIADTATLENLNEVIFSSAAKSRKHLTEGEYPSAMFDYVYKAYNSGYPWELTRDSLHYKFQINREAGYNWYYEDEACNGCFAAGINFGASLISLFYGEGDIKETIKIGALCGWDSDNPTATWGGILGYVYGEKGLEKAFGKKLSNKFNIHRTRVRFPNNGIDSFEHMAAVSLSNARLFQSRLHIR